MKQTILNRIFVIITSFGIAFSLLSCQGQQTQAEEGTTKSEAETVKVATSEKMDPADFWAAYEANKGAQLIDVRTPEEIAEGKVKGAKMINYRAGDFEEQLELLDKDQPVFLYCRSGGRSGQAAALMERLGFQHIVDMEGGMMAWQNAGLPIEK